jgi:hypothetical protein
MDRQKLFHDMMATIAIRKQMYRAILDSDDLSPADRAYFTGRVQELEHQYNWISGMKRDDQHPLLRVSPEQADNLTTITEG